MLGTMSYYRRYLLWLKKEYGDDFPIKDEEFDELTDAAEERYEEARRDGLTVNQAQELAMTVLLDRLKNGENQDGLQ